MLYYLSATLTAHNNWKADLHLNVVTSIGQLILCLMSSTFPLELSVLFCLSNNIKPQNIQLTKILNRDRQAIIIIEKVKTAIFGGIFA